MNRNVVRMRLHIFDAPLSYIWFLADLSFESYIKVDIGTKKNNIFPTHVSAKKISEIAVFSSKIFSRSHNLAENVFPLIKFFLGARSLVLNGIVAEQKYTFCVHR